jgi:hypothetical protein
MRRDDMRLLPDYKERKQRILEKITKRDFRKLSVKHNSMRERCETPKTEAHKKCYHDKGIRVCEEWVNDKLLFIEWAIDNGYTDDCNVIDRIDNSKGYSPDNCRFVSELKSLRNRVICRTEKEQEAVRVLLENGFPIAWINKYIKTPLANE